MKCGVLKKLLFLIAFLSTVMAIYGQTHSNHSIPTKDIGVNFKPVMSQEDIEVYTAPSIIKINVNHPVSIKIFTILGKLVSSHDLEKGSYEFNLGSHGVYILKTAETTCKVAI